MEMIVKGLERVRKVGEDDPRRVTHAVKVAAAVTLVSLFYYSHPLYHGFGSSAIWAVLTVVVVFEFSVGATLAKGLNRAMATLVAGALGVGAHSLASHCGNVGQPFLIGVFVFIQASISTFMRFFPRIKARYDYAFLICILTFSFVSISGFRVDEILELAQSRVATILIGVVGSVLISILVFPVWAGEDLHNLIANNLDKLGNSLEGFGTAFSEIQEEDAPESGDLSVLQVYRSVLNTKNTEESLANFAKWEPGHGQFRYRHPWKQYLILGTLIRECAYKMDALHAHLNSAHPVKTPLRLRQEIRDECNRMSSESSKALTGLAVSMKAMAQPSSTCKAHVLKSKLRVKTLQNMLRSISLREETDELLEIIQAATAASILIDIVNCSEKIVECAYELSSLAHFDKNELEKSESIKISTRGNNNQDQNSRNDNKTVNCHQVVINIDSGK